MEKVLETIGKYVPCTGRLNLSSHGITDEMLESIMDKLIGLKSLTHLNLHNNELRVVPDSIGKLTSLIQLSFNSNQIQVIPNSIGKLTSLMQLYIGHNQIQVIPDSIGELTSLDWLTFSDNNIQVIPDSIGKLTSLIHLYLGDSVFIDIRLISDSDVKYLLDKYELAKHGDYLRYRWVNYSITIVDMIKDKNELELKHWNELRDRTVKRVAKVLG